MTDRLEIYLRELRAFRASGAGVDEVLLEQDLDESYCRVTDAAYP